MRQMWWGNATNVVGSMRQMWWGNATNVVGVAEQPKPSPCDKFGGPLIATRRGANPVA